MSEASNFKIIVAMNQDLTPGLVMNAASHLCLGLTQRIIAECPQQATFLEFQTYQTSDGIELPFISARSLIVLRAKNGELRKLLGQIGTMGIPYVTFVETMTQGDYKEQLRRTSQASFAAIPIFGVACLADRSAIDPLTRRLSLWR